jgi:hypothetical protein
MTGSEYNEMFDFWIQSCLHKLTVEKFDNMAVSDHWNRSQQVGAIAAPSTRISNECELVFANFPDDKM